MHEDCKPEAWEDEIRPAGKVATVNPIPEASSVHEPTDKQFRFGVLTANRSHVATALLGERC